MLIEGLNFKVTTYYNADCNGGADDPLDAKMIVLMQTTFTLGCSKSVNLQLIVVLAES